MSTCFIMAAVAIQTGSDPDWAAARRFLASKSTASIVREWANSDCYESGMGEPIGFRRALLQMARKDAERVLNDVEQAWRGDRNDAGLLSFAGANILVTGEMSSGDCPDLVDSIDKAEAIGLLDAAGFTVDQTCPSCGAGAPRKAVA